MLGGSGIGCAEVALGVAGGSGIGGTEVALGALRWHQGCWGQWPRSARGAHRLRAMWTGLRGLAEQRFLRHSCDLEPGTASCHWAH